SDVLHKAKVEVDESGTKAAAATVVVVTECCMAIEPQETKEFIADEPFVFTIRDRKSGTILFMGTISNLSK
ncbi:MAG: serpin family protein, partial [Oscillospiraceae bacterium]